MKKRKKVLLLGAAGRIGTGFREEYLNKYKRYYNLILGVHSKKFKDKNLKIFRVELTDIKSLKKTMKGVDVVINLAANPSPTAKFEELLLPNIVGAYNVFEAAMQSKCSRVIFASSVHAIQGYGHGYKVKHGDVSKPIDLYGASKVFGEALCHVYFSRYGLSCLAIRVGAYTSNDRMRTICFSRQDYDHVISQRDMGQLIHRCIISPKRVKYGILSGISNNKHKDMELAFSKKLVGYVPKDHEESLCKSIKIKAPKKK